MTQEQVTDAQVVQFAKNGPLILALYSACIPVHAKHGSNGETFALACLARAHYTLETILGTRAREVDCAALCRVLYEHVVTFSWLEINPDEHFPMLQCWEYNERVKMFKGAKEFGHTWDEGAIRRSLVDMGTTAAPAIHDRAAAADRYWTRLGLDWQWRFKRSYSNLYRLYSCHVHPTIMGLDCFITRNDGGGIVGRPRAVHDDSMAAESVACFADGLAVASHRFGAPTIEQIVRALTKGLPGLG
jgi:hypothetical protein